MSSFAEIDLVTILVFAGVFVASGMVMAVVAGAAGGSADQRRRARLSRYGIKSAEDLSADLAATIRRRERTTRREVMDKWLTQALPRREALEERLRRTGKKTSLLRHVASCMGIGGVAAVFVLGMGQSMLLAGIAGVVAALVLPHMWVNALIRRRTRKFLAQFPEGIDQIVRGVRSGLPVSEAIAGIARELPDPIASEFESVIDQVRLGQGLDEALWHTARRMQLPEFNFLVISMVVQRETGGNLAETLENLSDIIRKRHQMQQKARAMSSEARASALIVGSLPFVLGGILMAINPEYMGKLFSDPRGNMLLGAAFTSEMLGFMVMTRMAKFEI